MLDDHAIKQGFDRLPVFRRHVPDGLELEFEFVVGAAFVFVEHQRIERDMQGFGEPDQGFQGGLRRPGFVAAHLVDVKRAYFL